MIEPAAQHPFPAPASDTVLAAVDNSLAARPVLEEAQLLAGVLGCRARAAHVLEGPSDSTAMAHSLARALGMPLQVLEGPAAPAICRALGLPDVRIGVLGARRGLHDGHGRVAGSTALEVLSRSGKPISVVPPQARIPRPGEQLRIALPIEGDGGVPAAADGFIRAVRERDDVCVLPVHVIVPSKAPLFWDQPHHAAAAWRHEFVVRNCPEAPELALRQGEPGPEIVRFATEARVHLVVLTWGRDLAPEHAWTVREVLRSGAFVVMLTPREADAGR